MTTYFLTFVLKSDTTFGRGDGVAGLLNREVEHDRYGLPYLRGRTLKGLLSEEADNILYALQAQTSSETLSTWRDARNALFGQSGSSRQKQAIMHYGHAMLPQPVREAVIASLGPTLTPSDILESLTSLRRQTAIDENGVPVDKSLRTMRVILRETNFAATLQSKRDLCPREEALLSVATMALRRAGTGRNRGRGRLQANLLDANQASILATGYQFFTQGGIQA